MTLRDEILITLARRRQATLAQLAKEIGDYYGVWHCLCSLRAEGKVLPSIRRGRPGRWRDGPVRYRLSHTQRRRMRRGAASKGASRMKKLSLFLLVSLALLALAPAAFAQGYPDSYPADLFRNVMLQDMAGWYSIECPFDGFEEATGAACAVLPRSPESARLWLDREIMGYSDLVMVTPWSRGGGSWTRSIYAEEVNQLIIIGLTDIGDGYETLLVFVVYPPGYAVD